MRGIERRIDDGARPRTCPRSPRSSSAAGTSPSPTRSPTSCRTSSGSRSASATYRAYRELLDSDRWQRLENEGARPQRLLLASTGTKDPEASDTLYVEALAAPHTINTMPDKTLLAFADHGKVGEPLPADGGDAEEVLAEFTEAGIDTDALAVRLQKEGAETFVKSWARAARDDQVGVGTPGRLGAAGACGRVRQATAASHPQGLEGAREAPRRDRATATCASSSPRTPTAASA